MSVSYLEQFHPQKPEEALAHVVTSMIARTPSHCTVFRKEEEWEDSSKMFTNNHEAKIWHLLGCRYYLLRTCGVILLQMCLFAITLLMCTVLELSAQ